MEKDFNFFATYNENEGIGRILKFFSIKKLVVPIIIMTILGLTLYQFFYIRNERSKLEEIIKEKESIRNELQQEEMFYASKTENTETETSVVNNEENQLKELEALAKLYNSKIDYRVLHGINNSLPQGVFVESIILEEPTEGIYSVVTGYSLSNNYIADFQNNLRNNSRFKNTFIDKITYVEGSGYAFSLFFEIIDLELENDVEEGSSNDL